MFFDPNSSIDANRRREVPGMQIGRNSSGFKPQMAGGI